MAPRPWVAVAEVLAPHGVDGQVVVRPLGSFPERFRVGLELRPEGMTAGFLRVRRVSRHRGLLLLAFDGIADRTGAERLRGARLLVPPENRYPLPPGHHYVDDLIGLPVFRDDGTPLGHLVDVQENPANDLLVVKLATGEEVLVPAVRRMVEIRADEGRIILRPIPGLLPAGGER